MTTVPNDVLHMPDTSRRKSRLIRVTVPLRTSAHGSARAPRVLSFSDSRVGGN